MSKETDKIAKALTLLAITSEHSERTRIAGDALAALAEMERSPKVEGEQEVPDFLNMPIEQVDEFLRSEGIDPVEERAYGRNVIERLKAEAGEQTEGEPVAWMSDNGKVVSASGKLRMEEAEHPAGIHYDIPLYAHPPQPSGLSDEVIEQLSQGRILATSSGQIACIDGGQESDVHGFSDGLRYARDHGYLTKP